MDIFNPMLLLLKKHYTISLSNNLLIAVELKDSNAKDAMELGQNGHLITLTTQALSSKMNTLTQPNKEHAKTSQQQKNTSTQLSHGAC
jgi:hypothetical protein